MNDLTSLGGEMPSTRISLAGHPRFDAQGARALHTAQIRAACQLALDRRGDLPGPEYMRRVMNHEAKAAMKRKERP